MRPPWVRALSFHPIPASFTPTVPNCYWVPWFVPQPYQRSYALYEVSVRQAGCFPTASFRSHLTMDTLAWGYMIPAIRTHLGDLHPLNSAHDGRTASPARDAPTGLAVFLPRIEAGRYASLDSRFTLHTFYYVAGSNCYSHRAGGVCLRRLEVLPIFQGAGCTKLRLLLGVRRGGRAQGFGAYMLSHQAG